MIGEELKTYFEKLCDKMMSYHLTPEQVAAILNYLEKTYPYQTDEGKICSKVMIDTGYGECFGMLAMLASGEPVPEQFAIDFCKL